MDFGCLLGDVLVADPGRQGGWVSQLAAWMQCAYEKNCRALAQEIGVFFTATTSEQSDAAQVFTHLIAAVQEYFGRRGSSTQLAGLLEGLCTGPSFPATCLGL